MAIKRKPFIHNADHPIEEELVRVVRGLLELWPWDRLQVIVLFEPYSRYHSRHLLRGVDFSGGGGARGAVKVCFNSSHLLAKPSLFINEVVPHELAHVFANMQAGREGTKVAAHGDEWTRCFLKLAGRVPQRPGDLSAEFDMRPAHLEAGGVLAVCECGEGGGLRMVKKNEAADIAVERRRCPKCRAEIKLTTDESLLPPDVQAVLTYLRDEKCNRQQQPQ